MPLAVYIHHVALDPDSLEPLLQLARGIYDLPEAPDRRIGCKDCDKLDRLMLLARKL